MEQICNEIAENLKKIRVERDLSLDQLANITGVSKSMLRQIETGNSIPTIATIWKIANGLKVSFTSLLVKCDSEVRIGKLKSKNVLSEIDGKYRVYPVVPFDPKRSYEIYFMEISPDTRYDAEAHEGNPKELIIVTEGVLTIAVDGSEYDVSEDEYINFNANQGHSYINRYEKTAKGLVVLTYF
ncbi:helix-turn-helix transcriptional regulator [Deferribacteraceae bacterium V6Fe1]|nr:helix-turn-helix transcriptional regulator [Deferribacteraceae bacterium V6Fe1]